jgi:hypothetical protein|tara:strand:- start:901 stop:1155 length:255 start_codon:yes stop_codon:yes gene_type:complete
MKIEKHIKEYLNNWGVPLGEEESVIEGVLDIMEYYKGDEYESLWEESVESTLSEYWNNVDWREVCRLVELDIAPHLTNSGPEIH